MTSVRDHGAAGDGRTDDTAAIQAAIDATSEDGEVRIPAGQYAVGPLSIRTDGIQLRGDGAESVLRFRGGGDTLIRSDANGVVLEALRLEDGGEAVTLVGQNVRSGARDDPDADPAANVPIFNGFAARQLSIACSNGASRGIVVSGTHGALIEGCDISQAGMGSGKDHDGICIHAVRETAVEGCTVRGNVVRGGFFRSIQSRGKGVRRDLRIEGNTVSGSVACGIWAYRAQGLSITDNRVTEMSGDGIFFDPTTARQGSGICANNRVERCLRFGILTEEAKNGSEISNNTILGCGTGILVGGGCRGLNISANTVADSGEFGILLDRFGGTPITRQIADISIIQNVIERSGMTGIRAKSVRRGLTIEGNSIDGSGSMGAPDGIAVEAAPARRRRGLF